MNTVDAPGGYVHGTRVYHLRWLRKSVQLLGGSPDTPLDHTSRRSRLCAAMNRAHDVISSDRRVKWGISSAELWMLALLHQWIVEQRNTNHIEEEFNVQWKSLRP